MATEEQTELRDVNLRKLEAENSIGVLVTLVAGFALALLPDLEAPDDCTCALFPDSATAVAQAFAFVYLVLLVGVASFSSMSVVYTTGLYFHGSKLLAKRRALKQQLDEFDEFWDGHKRSRQFFRSAFVLSLPSFVLSMGFSPKLWCSDCRLGLVALCILTVCAVCIYFISRIVTAPKKKSQIVHAQNM